MPVVLSAYNRAIGNNNDLLWRGLKPDIKRFKDLTLGHPVIMGRKTWDSLDARYRPLPFRTNIVMSRVYKKFSGAEFARNLNEALASAQSCVGSEEIFVIGGGQVYREALPLTDRLYLTLVDSIVDGDTFFPDYSDFTNIIESTQVDWDPKLTFLTLERPS